MYKMPLGRKIAISACLVLFSIMIISVTLNINKAQAKENTTVTRVSETIWEVENDYLNCIVVETYYGNQVGAQGHFPAVSCVRK